MIRLSGGEQRGVELRDGAGESVRADGTERGAVSLASGRSGSATPGRGFAQRIALQSKGRSGYVPPKVFTRLKRARKWHTQTYTYGTASEKAHVTDFDASVSVTLPPDARIISAEAYQYAFPTIVVTGSIPPLAYGNIIGYAEGDAGAEFNVPLDIVRSSDKVTVTATFHLGDDYNERSGSYTAQQLWRTYVTNDITYPLASLAEILDLTVLYETEYEEEEVIE